MLTPNDIAEGIRNDSFVFHYQPKISLITGKTYGAEALVRLTQPDGQLTLPDAFIPVAEQTSLMNTLTCHLFRKLLNDMNVLRDVGVLMSISFNASPRDFEDDAFTRLVLESLAVSHLPADILQIELTETATLGSGNKIMKHVQPLSEAGVGLAMDDFGKGYSSLDTLSKWPFTTIKLDQGLVGRMFDSEKNLTIVENSIRMAHELGISVVAEGVETHDQYRRLLEAGCTRIQGFWISKPLSLDRFIAFVSEDIRWSGMPVGLIHMATLDHVQWRKKLVSELVRAASVPRDADARRHMNLPPMSTAECKLGHWYAGLGQMFKDRPAFRDLDEPHRELHRVGVMLVDQVAAGANLAQITPGLRLLAQCSMKMLDLLHDLEFQGMIDMHVALNDWMAHELNPANLDGEGPDLLPSPMPV